MRFKKHISILAVLTLLVGQLSASAFTPYEVENRAKVLLYWGDVQENLTTGTQTNFDGTVSGNNGRVLALQTVAFESSDELVEKDSRATGEVEFESNIAAGVDGLLLLISENETQLTIETQELGTQTISISSLKSTDFSFDSGNFGLRAEYLGEDFLSTPENPSTAGRFDDTPTGEWYFKYVQRIKDREVEGQPIFEGYKTASGQLTGNFGPGDNITVGEMLKVVLRVSGLDEQNTNLDASLQNSTHWSVGFQNRAINEGLTIMDAVGINPDRRVTRGEFFQALSEAQGMLTPENFNTYDCDIRDLDFEDLNSNNPYTQYACILVKDGVISGTDDGYLNLNDNINRAEVAKILNTALDIYVEQPNNIESSIQAAASLDSSNNGSNNGGSTSSDNNSFVVSSTLQKDEIGYTSTVNVEFSNTEDVRESDIEVELEYNGSDISSDAVVSYDNGVLSVRRSAQWGTGEYTITVKDAALNEFKEFTFEVLNCGEQNNPCPATGKFVADSTLQKDEIGYTSAAKVEIGTPVNYRENDLEVTLDFQGSNVSDVVTSYSNGVLSVSKSIQWATGDYELTLRDTALNDEASFNFTVLNCGEQDNPCPATGSFVKDSTLGSTVIGYTKVQTVTFQEPSKVRESDIDVTLEFENNDVSNDAVVDYDNGVLSIRRSAQWGSGSYKLIVTDSALNESEEFFFTVTDQP